MKKFGAVSFECIFSLAEGGNAIKMHQDELDRQRNRGGFMLAMKKEHCQT